MKVFCRDKSFRRNCLSIWSIAMNVFYVTCIVAAAVVFDSDVLPSKNAHAKFMLILLYWTMCFGASVIVLVTLVKAKVERKL